MPYEEMTIDELTATSEMSFLEGTDEMAETIETEMLDALEQQTEFLAKYPNPTFTVLRLQYLTRSEDEETWQMLLSMKDEGTLLSHLMQTQEEAIQFIRSEKPKLMKAWNLTDEMLNEHPDEYKAQQNNLASTLKELAIKTFVEA